MAKTLNSRIPEGPVAEKWTNYKAHQRLVNPKNKLKLDIIVVGTGLAGASAAASLGEMGFNILNFCIQDSPRRAHSIAAQGGINAAKNYQNDGDSVYRLFYDTVKGGDYRAREANVYRLAEDFAEFWPEFKTLDELKEQYVKGGIGDGTCKKFLNSVINKMLDPIRARRHEFEQDIPEVFSILKKGSEDAREFAAQTMDEVRKAMRIDYFSDAAYIEEQAAKYRTCE